MKEERRVAKEILPSFPRNSLKTASTTSLPDPNFDKGRESYEKGYFRGLSDYKAPSFEENSARSNHAASYESDKGDRDYEGVARSAHSKRYFVNHVHNYVYFLSFLSIFVSHKRMMGTIC